MKGIESTGGPFILLSDALLTQWYGCDGDYERACEIEDWLGVLGVGSREALIVDDEPGANIESVNAIMQRVKSRACGYRNRPRFRRAIMFCAGGLECGRACNPHEFIKPEIMVLVDARGLPVAVDTATAQKHESKLV